MTITTQSGETHKQGPYTTEMETTLEKKITQPIEFTAHLLAVRIMTEIEIMPAKTPITPMGIFITMTQAKLWEIAILKTTSVSPMETPAPMDIPPTKTWNTMHGENLFIEHFA